MHLARPTAIAAIAAILCFLCPGAMADTLNDTASARLLTDQVMGKVGKGDMAGAVEMIRPLAIVPKAEFDVMAEQIKLQEPVLAQRFGKSIGQEFIRADQVGENLLRVVQLHRFERHAMRWNFYFYRGKDGWVLNTFTFSDDIHNLFPM